MFLIYFTLFISLYHILLFKQCVWTEIVCSTFLISFQPLEVLRSFGFLIFLRNLFEIFSLFKIWWETWYRNALSYINGKYESHFHMLEATTKRNSQAIWTVFHHKFSLAWTLALLNPQHLAICSYSVICTATKLW